MQYVLFTFCVHALKSKALDSSKWTTIAILKEILNFSQKS